MNRPNSWFWRKPLFIHLVPSLIWFWMNKNFYKLSFPSCITKPIQSNLWVVLLCLICSSCYQQRWPSSFLSTLLPRTWSESIIYYLMEMQNTTLELSWRIRILSWLLSRILDILSPTWESIWPGESWRHRTRGDNLLWGKGQAGDFPVLRCKSTGLYELTKNNSECSNGKESKIS